MKMKKPVPYAIGPVALVTLTIGWIAGPSEAQLGAPGNQYWHQDSPGVLGAAETGDDFGQPVAVGDFDNDGFEDLAIGVPFEDIGAVVNAGAVQVLYGAPGGLSASGNQLWHQDRAGMLDEAEWSDLFGAALASGDFDGDGFDDLAIGVDSEDIGALENAGAVQILYGGAGGLAAPGNQLWHQDSAGVLGVAESSDFFGSSLASGDLDNDGFDDLVIGVSREDIGAVEDAGVVQILYGAPGGLSASGNQLWNQDVFGLIDIVEESDLFGNSLVAGDFDNDGFGDLAIGVVSEDIGVAQNAGAVQLLYGGAGGLSATGSWFYHQASGLLDEAETADKFGSALASRDFDNDGFDDLAVGVPFEDVGTIPDAGAVQVLYGDSGGLSHIGNQFWHQNSSGIANGAEASDHFGGTLGAGDFDGDGTGDLAVGVPFEDIGVIEGAGAVQVLYGEGPIFSDGFESGDTSAWSSAVP